MIEPSSFGFDWDSISSSVGVSPDILKLLSLFLLSTPIAYPLSSIRFKSQSSLHLYSIICSSCFLLFVFNLYSAYLQLLISSLIVWSILHLTTSNQHHSINISLDHRIPWSIFFGLLAHLTINHARRLYWFISPDKVEITGAQMVLVIKLSTFAWNVYDGQQPIDKLDPYQRTTSIKRLPGLLEFLGYCFFFPSLLVGPAISFTDYSNFVNARHQALPLPPGRILHALRKIAVGLLFAAIVGLYGNEWSYERVLEGRFLNYTWFHRLWHLQVAGFMARGKYYLVWNLAEAAIAMSGCGYDARKGDWSGGRNIDIKEIELAQNYKGVFDNWNMKTNIWLRECVYKRVAVLEGNKPGFKSTMATFGASAAWHGPLPAYFLAFLSGGLLQALGRSIRGSIRPLFLGSSRTTKMIYDGLCIIGTQTSLNYLVVPFVLLDIRSTKVVYDRLGWYGHIMAGIPMILLWGFGLERRLRKRIPSSAATEKPTQLSKSARSTASNLKTIDSILHSQSSLVNAASSSIEGPKVISVNPSGA